MVSPTKDESATPPEELTSRLKRAHRQCLHRQRLANAFALLLCPLQGLSAGAYIWYRTELSAPIALILGTILGLACIGLMLWYLVYSRWALGYKNAWQSVLHGDWIDVLSSQQGLVVLTRYGMLTEKGSYCSIQNLIGARWVPETEHSTSVFFERSSLTKYIRRSMRLPVPIDQALQALDRLKQAAPNLQ